MDDAQKARQRLGELLPRANPPSRARRFTGYCAALVCVGALVSFVAGYATHNRFARFQDIDYALQRAETLAAQCKGIPLSEMRRRVEARINLTHDHFKLDDKIVAMDFAFDKIEALACILKLEEQS